MQIDRKNGKAAIVARWWQRVNGRQVTRARAFAGHWLVDGQPAGRRCSAVAKASGQPASDGRLCSAQKLQVSFDCDPHVVIHKAGESRIVIYLRKLKIIQSTEKKLE